MGRLLPKRGHFFKFVGVLRDEEYSKSRALRLLIESGGILGAKRVKRSDAEKARKIAEATAALEDGTITTSTFLNRMVFPKNNVCTDWEPFEDIFESGSEGNESADDEMENEMEDEMKDANSKPSKCIVCYDKPPNTALLPCKHLKCCNECVLKIQAQCIADGLNEYYCPYCRTIVEDTLQLFI